MKYITLATTIAPNVAAIVIKTVAGVLNLFFSTSFVFSWFTFSFVNIFSFVLYSSGICSGVVLFAVNIIVTLDGRFPATFPLSFHTFFTVISIVSFCT